MEDNKFDIQKIKRINKHISDALKQWSNIMLTADADEWAYYLNYSDEDMLNALFIFNHVWQNGAIKSDYFVSEEDIIRKMDNYRKAIKDTFGIDTVELTKKVLGKEEDNASTTEENSTEA